MISTLEEEAQKQIGAAKTFGKRMPSRSLDEEVLLGCELFVRKRQPGNHPRNLGTNILSPRSYSLNSHFESAGASKETQQERLVVSALFLMFNPFIRDPIVSHAIVSLSILFLAYFALAVTFLFHTPINPPLPMITVVSAIFSPNLVCANIHNSIWVRPPPSLLNLTLTFVSLYSKGGNEVRLWKSLVETGRSVSLCIRMPTR